MEILTKENEMESEESGQQQQYLQEELHFATIAILRKAAKFCSDAELDLLLWHCGIDREELEE